MRVFELHFNPPDLKFKRKGKLERDIIFDSFCYEPENIYEKRLGSLYLVGELKNVLPQNLRFLEKISQLMKEKYYSNYLKSPEEALKESLKSLNEFFSQEVKQDNTNWMGNLSLSIISIAPREKSEVELNFTKIGELKILLLRQGQISDIGTKLNGEAIEPYPLKVFSNILSGKIIEADTIAIFTKEVFSGFTNAEDENLIQEISREKDLNDRKIREILKPKEKELNQISGICLLVQVQPEIKARSILAFRERVERFPISQIFLSLSRKIKNSYSLLAWLFSLITKLKIPKISPFKIDLQFLRGLEIPTFSKNIILIFLLIFVLILGSVLAQKEKDRETQWMKKNLEEIESKINQAEKFLILKEEEKANLLFQEAWEQVLPFIKKEAPLGQETLALKSSIEKALNTLNKLEKIEEPEIFFEFNPKEAELIPSKILLFNSSLYFYNPLSSKIYKLELGKNEPKLLEGENNFQFGIPYLDSVLFFSKPNLIFSFYPVRNEISNGVKNDQFQEKTFELPDFNDLASFDSNIYFLDSKSGEIIKYQPASEKKEFWLNPQTKKPSSAKSIAVDGSIWILTKENQIDWYRRGSFQKTLKINLFPLLKNPTKIWTNALLNELYLLESEQRRIIILDKKGGIVKQFQSEKFDNLLDFAVSEDGKKIYLLNGLKVYQIKAD
jgi:hypothetical protein